MSNSDLRRAWKAQQATKQDVTNAIPALMGNGHGVVQVPNQPGYVYIRLGQGDLGQAYNNRCPLTDNLAIYVGYDPVLDPDRRIFQVLSVRMADYAGAGGTPTPNVPPHHLTHEYGGGDDVYVSWRRLMGFRVGRPSGFQVTVDEGVMIRAGAWLSVAAQTLDLTALKPGGALGCYVLIVLNAAGTATATAGASVGIGTLDISDCPIPGASEIPLAAVRLYGAQTSIGDTPTAPDIIDLRFPQATSTGDVHLEDLSDYARGHIIRGGAADWESYHAANAGFIVQGDGTDVKSAQFDWDVFSAGAGADMVHDHTSNAEGGTLTNWLGWFNVVDYGATGDGLTDDTDAIQDTIDAAEAAGGGVVYFPRGVYIVGGALQDGARSNAQLLLPRLDTATDAPMTIYLLGESPPPQVPSLGGTVVTPAGGSIIKGTLNAGAGGALIGAWGPVGSYADFSMVHVKVENLTIRMPTNPVLSALNFGKVVSAEICNAMVDTGSYDIDDIPDPTTNTSYGIVTPKNNNGAWTVLNNVNVIGFYYGVEINEHTDADGIQFWACKYAGRFLQGNHASHITRILVVWCESGLLFSGGTHYTDILQYDVEHYSGAPPKWFDPLNDVDDTNDYAEGLIRWQAVLSGTGPHNSFLVNGGANLQTIRITDDWGASADEKAKVSANDTTAGYLNGKLVAGTNVTLTENNDGGNETLTISAPGGSDHVHGLMRWAADGGATIDLVDIAEYVEAISDDGAIVDPLTWTLSADGSQVTFDAGPTAASVMTAQYVIARV